MTIRKALTVSLVGLLALLVQLLALAPVLAVIWILFQERLVYGPVGSLAMALAAVAYAGLAALIAPFVFKRIGYEYHTRWHLLAGIVVTYQAVTLTLVILLIAGLAAMDGSTPAASIVGSALLVCALPFYLFLSGLAMDWARGWRVSIAQLVVVGSVGMSVIYGAGTVPGDRSCYIANTKELRAQLDDAFLPWSGMGWMSIVYRINLNCASFQKRLREEPRPYNPKAIPHSTRD